MFGAIIGDIVGSRFEFNNYKGKDFKFFDKECSITDDSVMTIALAKALLESKNTDEVSDNAVKWMRYFGKKYINAGYGGRFLHWLIDKDPKPYYSWGNGSALLAFFESTNFEDAVRNAISIGGDSDTIGAITGSIAEAYYGIPKDIRVVASRYIPKGLLQIVNEFEMKYPAKAL